MHNSEIIPALIARIRQNNTDNVVIRSKLYNLLNDVTNKFDDVIKSTKDKPYFKSRHNGK